MDKIVNQPANCKYTQLEKYLSGLANTRSEMSLTFDQIEAAMHSKLPKSAYMRNAWWDNAVQGSLSHKHAWLHAGWQVDEVNLSAGWVHLARMMNKGK